MDTIQPGGSQSMQNNIHFKASANNLHETVTVLWSITYRPAYHGGIWEVSEDTM